MDEFKVKISELFYYLKTRKMCSSSIRSHEECYTALVRYLKENTTCYSKNAENRWLRSVQLEMAPNKFDIWVWYKRQLIEFLSKGFYF